MKSILNPLERKRLERYKLKYSLDRKVIYLFLL